MYSSLPISLSLYIYIYMYICMLIIMFVDLLPVLCQLITTIMLCLRHWPELCLMTVFLSV